MKKFFVTIAACSIAMAAPALAQVSPKPGTANTPSSMTTPGSMNNTQPVNPATGTTYVPQTNMNSSTPATPQSTAINPATGTTYTPQVNMNPSTAGNPSAIGNGVSAQPSTTTPSAPQQPNTSPATTPPATTPQ